ncbi:VOC family protein [Sphaerisporangium fuscum]|uniref:VOC family protein n=1 Tax=Sphaerisporangium fuscum TaxID=2835868 RepID=UPI001BDDC362|nr:VOC family protein [Sphaerisporangium fuscum]
MPIRSDYPDGAPCWPELITPDLAGATRFYHRVFGWAYQDLGPRLWNSTLCLADGEPVAAMAPPAIGTRSVRTRWTPYLATSDVEASAVRVEANDGKLVVLPTTMPGFGKLAVALDTDGAPFGLWEAGSHSGARRVSEPGAMCWFELHTKHTTSVDAFYRALFGYEQEQVGDGVDFDYCVWKIGGVPVCGRLKIPYESRHCPCQWVLYLTVADREEAVARVVKEGGEVVIDMYELPQATVAVVLDCSGAMFAVCEFTDMAHHV